MKEGRSRAGSVIKAGRMDGVLAIDLVGSEDAGLRGRTLF